MNFDYLKVRLLFRQPLSIKLAINYLDEYSGPDLFSGGTFTQNGCRETLWLFCVKFLLPDFAQ